MDSRHRAVARGRDPLHDSAGLFPLGRPFGRVVACAARPSTTRPFGLRFAVLPKEVTRIDTTAISYDHVRQIGVMQDGGQWLPLVRHTDGKTSTKTSDCQGGLDSDEDVRED